MDKKNNRSPRNSRSHARPEHLRSGSRSGSRRRNLYRKSRRYREQRRKQILALGAAVLVLMVLLIALIVKGCSGGKTSPTGADAKNAQTSADSGNGKTGDSGSGNNSAGDKTEGAPSDKAKGEADAEKDALPAEPVSLTVSVVGDCTLGTDENFDYSTSLNAYYESNGPDYFLANVKSIFSKDDLTIANFEGTLTDSDAREDKQFAFKAPAEYAKILSSGSVEAVNTANNHSHDYGEQSFTDTLAALDSEKIVHFGYDETAVMDVKGIKVGLVGIYELNDHLGREEQLKQNIAKVKQDGAQLVIVIFHWGNEREEVPDTNQMTLGRLAIDEGADLVCGHHPHVLQGIETYKGKNIVYSLGNFCFGGNSGPSDMDTMIFQQTFTVDKNGVKADNMTNIIPCSISSAYDYNNYQPTPAEGEEADRILNKIKERSSWIPTAEGDSDTSADENSDTTS